MHKRDLHQNKDARRFLLILLGLAIVMIGCQLKAYAGDQAEQAEEPLPTARSESNDVLAEGYHHILSLELDRAIACFVKPLIDANRRSLALPANRKHAARCLAFIGRCLAFDNNIASLQALILAHRLDPGNSSILALLARYLDSNGRIEEADAIYKQLQSHANSNFIVAIALGNRALHVCDFQTAERHCRQAVALAPAKSVTHYCLGKALEARGFNKEAAAQHRQAASHEESTYLKEILLGGADELEAKPGSAALHYRAAGDILPDDPLWMSRLAFCQTAQQRRDAPLELLARAARCRRLHVKTLSNYALAQLFSNQAEKALYTINYAAICSPSASQTELVRGCLLYTSPSPRD